MAQRGIAPTESAADLLKRDPEEARDLLEVKKSDRSQGDILEPPRDDPRHGDQSVPPGQDDVPAGGTSGGHIRGGGMGKRGG